MGGACAAQCAHAGRSMVPHVGSSGTRTALATRRVELRRLRTDTKESVALSTHVESEVGRESGEAVGEVGRDSRTCLGHGCTWL